MIIGVFSDSHDNIEKIKKAVSFFNDRKVDLVIHAGDFIAPFSIAPMEELNCQLVCVFGNNDGERIGLYNRIKDIGEVHTQSPGPTPNARHAICSALVALLTATA